MKPDQTQVQGLLWEALSRGLEHHSWAVTHRATVLGLAYPEPIGLLYAREVALWGIETSIIVPGALPRAPTTSRMPAATRTFSQPRLPDEANRLNLPHPSLQTGQPMPGRQEKAGESKPTQPGLIRPGT
jgi:hypothetical protein